VRWASKPLGGSVPISVIGWKGSRSFDGRLG
jgi:hypothetical protein